MKRRASSRSGLFLLEMMISILFFAIAAVVCIQVFVKADQLSRRAENLDMAAGICASAAELLACGNEEEIAFCYDSGWMPCEQRNAEFFLEISTEGQGRRKTWQIRVTDKKGTCIFEMETGHYFPWKKEGKVTGGE